MCWTFIIYNDKGQYRGLFYDRAAALADDDLVLHDLKNDLFAKKFELYLGII